MSQLLEAAEAVIAIRDGAGHSIKQSDEAFDLLRAAVADAKKPAAKVVSGSSTKMTAKKPRAKAKSVTSTKKS